MRLIAVLLLFFTLSGCASSGGDQGNLLGGPRIRTVGMPSIAADGGVVAGSSLIRYVEDPVVVRDLIQAPADSAWIHLLSAYREEGLVPDGIDMERKLVSLSRFELSQDRNGLPLSTYLECGVSTSGGLLADRSQIVGSIVSQVSSEGEKNSAISTRFEAFALPLDGGGGRAQDCVTTGRFERDILGRIQVHLNASALSVLGPGVVSPPRSEEGSRSSMGRPGGVPDYEYFSPGDQIRVKLSRIDRWTGTFLGFRSDSLLLKRSRVTPLAFSWIQELEVKKTNKKVVWAGALVGIASGVAIATNTPLGITGDHDVQGKILNPGLGAVVGGLVGGLLGAKVFGTSWIVVPLDVFSGG